MVTRRALVQSTLGLFASMCPVYAASAQSVPVPASKSALPTENVTVTGTKSREIIQDFAGSFAAHTYLIGKIARWRTGICPITVGMPADANAFVTARLKVIADKVGAPVSTGKACKHNIEIVFTRTPQALLDNVKKDQEEFLGYHDNLEQRDRLATVTRPIQAWYTTATEDLNGVLQVDSSMTASPGRGLMMQLPCSMMRQDGGAVKGPGVICTGYLPYARKYNSIGFRARDGLQSGFYNIIVVADISKIGSQQLDAVGGYIAMLALSQPSSLDACPPLSSIISFLGKDCSSRADRLTDADTSYLEGVYKMNSEMNLGIQERQIAGQMEQAPAKK